MYAASAAFIRGAGGYLFLSRAERQKERTDMTEEKTTLSPAAQTALTTILNLRKLTKATGTITTRAQNDILRALTSMDIGAVAMISLF